MIVYVSRSHDATNYHRAHGTILRIHRIYTSLNKCKAWIHGIETIVEPDTGADTNVMDEEQFKTLQHARPEVRLRKTTIKLKTLTADLPVIGEFTATIETRLDVP